jgi:5-methyltetrahydrofolate--homocysteine methyltransferase
VYTDDSCSEVLTTFHFLRQQSEREANRPYCCLADFIAPRESGKKDYLGAFAVTAGIGVDRLVEHFEKDQDDYTAILVKVLADRMAEGFAEYLHERVRQEWGYEQSGNAALTDLLHERYRGIRPAPGYPACPDHREKKALFDLLQVEKNTGITLTGSFAMMPAASVSGFYFSHPESRYFNIGKIGKDQVIDYARRTTINILETERWLAPVLGYEPEIRPEE